MLAQTNLKKGFTLIELMVVIVIIGILAAIAIPKLFGMSAKAKAQEVGPAAGTWIKLQQAYQMEVGEYGTFKKISYKVPGPNGGGDDGKDSTANFQYDVSGNDGLYWKANSRFVSDPCEKNTEWNAKFTKDQTVDDPTIEIEPAGGSDIEGCASLTPNYCNMGVKGANCTTLK